MFFIIYVLVYFKILSEYIFMMICILKNNFVDGGLKLYVNLRYF